MPVSVQTEATEGSYGRLRTEAPAYRPLDTVRVRVGGRAAGDARGTIRVCDPEQRCYVEAPVELHANEGEFSFTAGGALGVHYVYLQWPGETRHSRYVNFRLDAETAIESGDADFDDLYPFTRERMRLARREYATPRGPFVGYISADTWHFDGIWLRDWIYGLPAFKHWEREMLCGLDRFLEVQSGDGMVPDGIERDGRTWRVGLESDVEYILTLAVWQAWQATGDNAWLADALPRLEKALRYIQNDPKHWDPRHRLVKRQHSCDTWDFDVDGASDQGQGRHVIAACDQSGYVLAFRAMSRMYRGLGREEPARQWGDLADDYARRASALLWDGTKFQHHIHLDAIDHGDFDERAQLAMGNTWAMTRGWATEDQAARIVDEYRRRHEQTGDAYPWWSLQPGYPDHLGYFGSAYCRQGGYANGGLMPWVGGELCRAAFGFGREAYGVELLRQYASHLRRTGGAHVWYWPDGQPGFRTTNEVPYAGWGMAEWVNALVEGLAGVTDESACMRDVQVAPRWAATPVTDVRVTTRYAASNGYFAYRMTLDERARTIGLTCTGSGRQATVSLLLPAGWQPRAASLNGQPCEAEAAGVGASRYAVAHVPLQGVATLRLVFH